MDYENADFKFENAEDLYKYLSTLTEKDRTDTNLAVNGDDGSIHGICDVQYRTTHNGPNSRYLVFGSWRCSKIEYDHITENIHKKFNGKNVRHWRVNSYEYEEYGIPIFTREFCHFHKKYMFHYDYEFHPIEYFVITEDLDRVYGLCKDFEYVYVITDSKRHIYSIIGSKCSLYIKHIYEGE